jgi:hypothetical protein
MLYSTNEKIKDICEKCIYSSGTLTIIPSQLSFQDSQIENGMVLE